MPVELLADAVCRADDVRTEVFYPMPSDAEAIEVAKAICAGCPVRLACLEYAVDHFEQHGVWGGTTPDERVEIRKASA